jgi:hypothetical protein
MHFCSIPKMYNQLLCKRKANKYTLCKNRTHNHEERLARLHISLGQYVGFHIKKVRGLPAYVIQMVPT